LPGKYVKKCLVLTAFPAYIISINIKISTKKESIMKRLYLLNYFALIIISFLLIAGCSIEAARTFDEEGSELILNLRGTDLTDRTILPNIDMTISRYDITGNGPGGAIFQITNISGSTVTKSGLKFGVWNIKVNAKNSSGVKIADGETNVTIINGTDTTANVTVSPLAGNGTLSVNADWTSSGQFTSAAVVTGSVRSASGIVTALSFTKSGTTAASNLALLKGYYYLMININEGGSSWGLVEALRIVYGQTTAANISVQGASVPKPEINVKEGVVNIESGTGTFDLGNVDIGSGGSIVTFTIENIGNADLELTGMPLVAVSGADASMFNVEVQPSSTIAGFSSTEFIVTFNPTSAGDKTAMISILNNDDNEDPYTFSLTGTGVDVVITYPEINIKQGTANISVGGNYNFGNINIGSSLSSTFAIENLGDGSLELNGDPAVSIVGIDFTVTLQPASSLAPAGTSTFRISFDPASTGSKTAIVIISNNDSDENPYTFTLLGECADPKMVDNFENGADPNLWGGNYLTFATQTAGDNITGSYDSSNGRNGSSYAYKLNYSVPNAGSFAGMKLEVASGGGEKDLSGYKYFSFWVKGSATGIPMKIEFQNSTIRRNSAFVYINDYLDGGITTSWREVRIPLDAFCFLDRKSNINGIVFVFEYDYAVASGYPVSGTVYLDDISFSDQSLGYLRIDSFGDNWGINALGGNNGDMGGAGGSHASEYSTSVYHNYSRGLKSTYDLTMGGWGGYWFLFGSGGQSVPVDLSAYNKISLWAKAIDNTNKPYRIKIEVVDTTRAYVTYIPSVSGTPPLSTAWTKYEIDLNGFDMTGLDKTKIKQFNIVYGLNDVGTYKNTSVIFDEIQFETASVMSHSGTLEISGSRAVERSLNYFCRIDTVTRWVGQHPTPWPDPKWFYTYNTEQKVSYSQWPWEYASGTMNTLEDRYMAEFDLAPWYALGLSAGTITSVEFIVNGTVSTAGTYTFSVNDMQSNEDGLFLDAKSDYEMSTANIQTFSQSVSGTVQFSSVVANSVVSDINSSKYWSGILIKSETTSLPLLTFSSPVLRINYSY
jgi:hypothetical protein